MDDRFLPTADTEYRFEKRYFYQIDEGEVVTTTHYYVVLNLQADLSAVEEYRIAPVAPYKNATRNARAS